MSLPLSFNTVYNALDYGFGTKVYYTLRYKFDYGIADRNHDPNDLSNYSETFLTGIDESISHNSLSGDFILPPFSADGTFVYTVSLSLIRNPFRCSQLDRLFTTDSKCIDVAKCNMTVSNFAKTEYFNEQNYYDPNDNSWNRFFQVAANGLWYGGRNTITESDAGTASLGLFGITKDTNSNGCESILLSTKSSGGSCKSGVASASDITDLTQKYFDSRNQYMFYDYWLIPPNNGIEVETTTNIRDSLRKLVKILVSQNYNITWVNELDSWWGFGSAVSRLWTWDSIGISNGLAKMNLNDFTLSQYSRVPSTNPVAM